MITHAKLVFCCLLLAIGISTTRAQNNTNLTIARPNPVMMRGDSTNFTITISGNYANRKLEFVVKSDKVPTGVRLIRKRNFLAGGSDSELTASYSSPNTTITVKLLSEDTQDFLGTKYYYDVSAENVGSAGNYVTVISGEITMRYDIGSPLNGSQLAADGTRYIPIDANHFNNLDIVQVRGGDYKGIQPNALIDSSFYNKTQIDAFNGAKADTNLSKANVANVRTRLLINNLDNTSDLNKPISSATQTALDRKRGLSDHDSLSNLDEKKFVSLTDKPTTVGGYGITDAYTKTEVDNSVGTKRDTATSYSRAQIDNLLSPKFDTSNFGSYFNTNLSGKTTSNLAEGTNLYWTNDRFDTRFNSYISNYYTKHLADSLLNLKQTALNGTGFVKISGATISYDNSTYLTTETDPTIYSWAKAATKPSYSYSEISGLGTIVVKDTSYYYRSTNPSNFIALTALSSTATGLTYTNTTGAFSLTSGYVIPTTTQETNWGTAYSNTHSHANKSKLDSLLVAASFLNSIIGNLGSNAYTSTAYVPQTTTVNGHALSGNVSVTATDVGLGNVTNESKATMFTSPTFTGTINLGNTLYVNDLTKHIGIGSSPDIHVLCNVVKTKEDWWAATNSSTIISDTSDRTYGSGWALGLNNVAANSITFGIARSVVAQQNVGQWVVGSGAVVESSAFPEAGGTTTWGLVNAVTMDGALTLPNARICDSYFYLGNGSTITNAQGYNFHIATFGATATITNLTAFYSDMSTNITRVIGTKYQLYLLGNVPSYMEGSLYIGKTTSLSKLAVVGLPFYADNAAALVGGLTAGDFYRTSTGVLMVTY